MSFQLRFTYKSAGSTIPTRQYQPEKKGGKLQLDSPGQSGSTGASLPGSNVREFSTGHRIAHT
eukprot:90572-Rhodomonas_salina.6